MAKTSAKRFASLVDPAWRTSGMVATAGAGLLLASCVTTVPEKGDQEGRLPIAGRLVCLGDSITDGYTYGQIIRQALREAARPEPAVICAGVAGDTAPQMAARLERTVLAFQPALVTFSAGTNDFFRGVTPEQYEAALREIAARLKGSGASMILLTPCEILKRDGKTPAEQEASAQAIAARLDAFERIIRQVANEYGWPVAENRALMEQAVAAGQTIMVEDGIHPNYLGQSLMARAILDAMGENELPLPAVFAPSLFPGVVRQWQIRPAPVDGAGKPIRLTPETAAHLQADHTWAPLSLPDPVPEAAPTAEEWLEQLRRNGFSTQHEQRFGKGLLQAAAELDGQDGRTVWLQIGGSIATVWLNGVKIHDQGGAWTGFHAGKERLPVTLAPAGNRLVLEIAGPHFFVAATKTMVWEEEL